MAEKRKLDDDAEENEGTVSTKYWRTEGRPTELRCWDTPACSYLEFKNKADLAFHRQTQHRLVCAECRRILPSQRLLHLHLLEVHDSFFQALAEKKKMYECFVDDCNKVFFVPASRKKHLIAKHDYAKDYNFDIILGRHPKSGRSTTLSGGSLPPSEESEMQGLVTELQEKMIHLKIPPSISFGTRKQRTFGSHAQRGSWNVAKTKDAHQNAVPGRRKSVEIDSMIG